MISENNPHNEIFDIMIKQNLIPKEGNFDITLELLKQYNNIYRKIKPPKDKKYNPRPNHIRYHQKLAFINLLQENQKRLPEILIKKNNTVKVKSGLLYLISNPAFPDMYKIGITQDLPKRLNAYQTCDPYRKFKVEHYKFVEDMRETEKKFLDQFKTDITKGEWINSNKVKEVFLEFKE